MRAAARPGSDGAAASATSTGRARPRRTGSRSGTRADRRHLAAGSRTRSDSPSASARSPRSTPAHPHTKRALAITPVKFGISFNLTAFNQAGALVHIYKDGSVLINHGGTEMGQGLHTKMLQVAATTLGIPLHMVRLAPTRTDKVPNTSATAASAGADLNGAAVKNACEQFRDRLLQVAGPQFGVDAADVRIVEGVARVASAATRSWPGTTWCAPRTSSGSSCRRPASTGPRAALGREDVPGLAVQVLLLRRRRGRGRGGRLHRRVPDPAGGHRARRRRQPLPDDRHRSGRGRRSCRAPAG